jgi:hypothetical protein
VNDQEIDLEVENAGEDPGVVIGNVIVTEEDLKIEIVTVIDDVEVDQEAEVIAIGIEIEDPEVMKDAEGQEIETENDLQTDHHHPGNGVALQKKKFQRPHQPHFSRHS